MRDKLVRVPSAIKMMMLIIILMSLLPQSVAAQGASVRVLSSVGLRGVLDKMIPEWQRQLGHPIEVRFDTSTALKAQISAGQGFDLVVLPSGLVDALVKEGKVSADKRAEIARAGIGIGIRAGSPKPDISTPEALKRVLLDAKTVTYPQNGASRSNIENIFDQLEITKEVGLKTIFPKGEGRSQASVAEGEVELVITLISEIVPVRGIELLGPLPAGLQHYVSFTAGVSKDSPNATVAQALIKCMSDPSMHPALIAAGLEPR
jgi:molybdate transport system substrate-binding protein